MKISTNTKELQGWAVAKQANEQEMLQKLNELFKEQFPTENMRKVVLAAFTAMGAEVARNTTGPSKGAIEAEKNLAVWEETNKVEDTRYPPIWQATVNKGDEWVKRLFKMRTLLCESYNQPNRLDCNDLSELIRVVGAWLEKGGGFGGYEEINKAWRVGVGELDEATVMANYEKDADKKRKQYEDDLKAWKEKKVSKGPMPQAPLMLSWKGNKQLILQDGRDQLQWGKGVRQREDPFNKDPKIGAPDQKSFHHEVPDYLARYWVKPKQGKEAGTQMFQVNQNDLCKKIDLLFGLYKGATISGTTTDTVFVLETFGQQIGDNKQLHPGYYLFPVATIAASLHHTLVEVALSLALDGAIDTYSIGFYSSLAPKGGFPKELEKAHQILKEHETKPGNGHFILWYDGDENQPVGGVRFEGSELNLYRKAVDGKALLPHLRGLPNVPTIGDVSALFRKAAPLLYGNYLDKEFTKVVPKPPKGEAHGDNVKKRYPFAA